MSLSQIITFSTFTRSNLIFSNQIILSYQINSNQITFNHSNCCDVRDHHYHLPTVNMHYHGNSVVLRGRKFIVNYPCIIIFVISHLIPSGASTCVHLLPLGRLLDDPSCRGIIIIGTAVVRMILAGFCWFWWPKCFTTSSYFYMQFRSQD